MPEHETARRHLVHGWTALFVFVTLGLVLEGLHGLKVGWYLDVANETRRSMFTLAHAHGTLLGILQLSFAHTLHMGVRPHRAAGRMLDAASLLLPCGFFIGGVWVYSGDPGAGILLVPAGAVLLVSAIALTLRSVLSTNN
ncbi:MAG: hypothetical protein ACJAYU_002803 [Bradymonadia bacterium]|jgi:hypothetical protein